MAKKTYIENLVRKDYPRKTNCEKAKESLCVLSEKAENMEEMRDPLRSHL
tara:strand:+ start:621 stop:770 length:150 start_codon:yes stop_codon:yes gene_type:complete